MISGMRVKVARIRRLLPRQEITMAWTAENGEN